jgi:hypothetical protein
MIPDRRFASCETHTSGIEAVNLTRNEALGRPNDGRDLIFSLAGYSLEGGVSSAGEYVEISLGGPAQEKAIRPRLQWAHHPGSPPVISASIYDALDDSYAVTDLGLADEA